MNKVREGMIMTAFESIFRIAATRTACSANEDLSLEFAAKESMRIALETVDLACIDESPRSVANTLEVELQARVDELTKDLECWKAWSRNQLQNASVRSITDDSGVLRCELSSMIRDLRQRLPAR